MFRFIIMLALCFMPFSSRGCRYMRGGYFTKFKAELGYCLVIGPFGNIPTMGLYPTLRSLTQEGECTSFGAGSPLTLKLGFGVQIVA
jgi:hypothetical protein